MTSLSDGLGPQKDPNSGRTRVESGPAGTHRPSPSPEEEMDERFKTPGTSTPGTSTPGRRRPIASRARPTRGSSSPKSAWRAEGAGRPEPASRPTRRRRSRPVGQPAPEGNESGGQHRRPACRRRRRPIASRAGAEGAGADPRRNGDDYPMTSLSDGLGPQKDPNSGRTRVESGPAGTHRPTTRRGSA